MSSAKKASTKPLMSRKRAVGSKDKRPHKSSEQSNFAMMRFGRLEDMDRSFDIEFWQRQGDAAIFRAAWELVESYCRDRGMNLDELRLQRSVETFKSACALDDFLIVRNR
jgi:hypothetical protein